MSVAKVTDAVYQITVALGSRSLASLAIGNLRLTDIVLELLESIENLAAVKDAH